MLWMVVGIWYSFISHIWRVGYRLHRGETYKYKEHIGIEEHQKHHNIMFLHKTFTRREHKKKHRRHRHIYAYKWYNYRNEDKKKLN